MARNEKTRQRTFRIGTTVVGVTGTVLEMTNPAESGIIIRFHKFVLASTVANSIFIRRFAAAATGGTSSDISSTIAPAKFGVNVSVAVIRAFTAAPTPGTQLDQLFLYRPAAGLIIRDDIQSEDLQPVELSPGETLGLFINNAAAIDINAAWTEENF